MVRADGHDGCVRRSPNVLLLRVLESGAVVLRRLGLSRIVDAVGAQVTRAFGPFTVELDGLVIHGHGAAHMHYVQELEQGREGYFVELVRQASRPGAVVLEAGAHLGYVTAQAARAVGRDGHVYAFEPNPGVRNLLEENLVANGLRDRVSVVSAALADDSGTACLHVTEGGDTSSLYGPADDAVPEEVTVVTADEYLGSRVRVDVVKLDVEGGELAALRGMQGLLARSRPGPVIFVECNPPLLESAGTSADGLVAWLAEAGFDVSWIDEEDRRTRPLTELPAGGYVNLVCERR